MTKQSYEHRLRRSMSSRIDETWEHYEELFKLWQKCDFPNWYVFKMVAVKKGFSPTFNYQNMCKWFYEDWEREMVGVAETGQITAGAKMFADIGIAITKSNEPDENFEYDERTKRLRKLSAKELHEREKEDYEERLKYEERYYNMQSW